MSDVQDLKQSLDTMMSKKNVISQEALFAKGTLHSEKRGGAAGHTIQQEALMTEFNQSISILVSIFKQSRFDEVMGLVAHPLRFMLLNFFLAFFRGIGFVFGGVIVVFLVWYLARGLEGLF